MRFYLALVLSAFFGLLSMNVAAAASFDFSGIFLLQGTFLARTTLFRSVSVGMGIMAVLFFVAMKYQNLLNVKLTKKYDTQIEHVLDGRKAQDRIDTVVHRKSRPPRVRVVYQNGHSAPKEPVKRAAQIEDEKKIFGRKS